MANELYVDELPSGTMYHYTSIKGFHDIVKSKALWATHVNYMNDSSEIRYAIGLLITEISKLILDETADDKLRILKQLDEWLRYGRIHYHLLFVCSFTPDGDRLSQWRAYTPPGEGISLGFDADKLTDTADAQQFYITKCVYDREVQVSLVEEILRCIMVTANDNGEAQLNRRSKDQSYYGSFEKHEKALLTIAAKLKHPAFKEEKEWRAISAVSGDYKDPLLKFRNGATRLIPYTDFRLPTNDEGNLQLEKLYVGPSREISIAFSAVDMFLANQHVSPRSGSAPSGAPWRSW